MTSSVVSSDSTPKRLPICAAGRDRVAVSWGDVDAGAQIPGGRRVGKERPNIAAACTAPPVATVSSASGTRIAAPSRSARIWRYAGLLAPPPIRCTRPSTAAPAAAKASRPKSRPRSTPSWAARARSADVVSLRSPSNVPVASGRLGVRSPSK